MKTLRISLLVAVLSLVVAACATPPPPPEPVTVEIDMTEYAFNPADLEFRVGQEVTLVLKNSGSQPHELMIGRQVAYSDAMQPAGFEVDFWHMAGVMPSVLGGGQLMQHDEHAPMDMDAGSMGMMATEEEHPEGAHSHDVHDMGSMGAPEDEMPMMVYFAAGAEPTVLKFTVTEDMLGEWEIGCFELNGVHYTAGMKGSLTILP